MKERCLRLMCAISILLGSSILLHAQQAGDVLSVDQAVNEAIAHNLDFLAQKYDLTVAEAQIVTAKLRPNPILTLDGDHLDLLGTGFSSTSTNGKMPNNGGPVEYSARADYLYERGGKRQARTQLAVGNRDVTRLQLADAVRGLIFTVQSAFVDVAAAKNSLKLAQENLTTFDNVVTINQVRYKDGDIAQVELLRSEVAQLQFANSVRQAELQEKSSLSRLQLLLGRTKLQTFDVVGDLRKDAPSEPRDALLNEAFQQRPDLQALVRDEARAQADLRLQKANAKVDWQFGTEYRKQDATAHADTLGLFLQSQIPLFNRNQGEIARAQQGQLQTQARSRALRATVENDVDLALLQYQTSRDALQKIEGSMLGKARDVRGISEYAYKRGEVSFVDFLDAVRAYNDTMQSYNDARGDYARSLYGLDATAMKRFALYSLFFCLILSGCSRKESSQVDDPNGKATVSGSHIKLAANSPQLARIQTATAVKERVPQVELVLPAKVEANPTRVSHIALPVSGRIRQVLVNLGDTVRQGQAVLTVDSPDAATAMSTYRQAEANIAMSKALLAKADADLTRTKDLEAHGAAAQKDVLAAAAVQVQSQAALTQAQASLEESLKRLEVLGIKPCSVINQYVTVYSSVNGKVTDINAVGGEFRNDTNTPFLTVADLSTVWVAADVPEDQVRFIRVGSPVEITMNSFPGETFKGQVMRVGDTVDPQTRTIKVRAALPNPQGRFRPDMFATIRETQGEVELPVVPRGAILESQGKTSVYVERGKGDYEEVQVKIGWQGPDRVSISSGVQSGDHVVVSGGMLLRGY
jgi:RND family efflux transporter MFP subunit